jgi:hypothetical protein
MTTRATLESQKLWTACERSMAGMEWLTVSQNTSAPLRHIVAMKPRDRGVFDFTEMPKDPTNENRYIFGIVDVFSRKAWAVGLPSRGNTLRNGNLIMGRNSSPRS